MDPRQLAHPGLCTDLYQLRMAQSYLAQGMMADATFSLFIRPAPRRPWYVALGVHRVLEYLEALHFDDEALEHLATIGVDEATREWLGQVRFTGEVWAVPDGTVVLAQEPILEITAPQPVAQLVETAVINLVQYPTLVATKAARCALAADRRAIAEFGFRRAHGLETGIEAALAAWVGGGMATSNVEAGRRHDLPVTGTMAHSYVQSFADERDAFRAFAADQPEHSTLLVDTYDTLDGVRHAIAACSELEVIPRGVRLDSGDLGELARGARRLLDDAGFADTRIIASGGLDEHSICALVDAGAPIDAFGVGTALVTSRDHPALDIVYKLVESDGRSVAKFSGMKGTFPGPKQVWRPREGPAGDVLDVRAAVRDGEPLLQRVWAGDRAEVTFDRTAARERVVAELDRLPAAWRRPPYVDEAPVPDLGADLRALDATVRRAAFGDG